MKAIPKKVICEVEKKTRELFKILDEFPFIGVAAAIEMAHSCHIQFMKKAKYKTTCLMTCDEYSILTKQSKLCLEAKKLTQRHFIFCKELKTKEYEAFTIAHELGHVYLHWPLKGDTEIWYKSTASGYDTYTVKFNLKQEQEADVFGCLLTTHLPDGITNISRKFDHKKLMKKIGEFGRKRFLHSSRFKD